jgi:hypothetical protein
MEVKRVLRPYSDKFSKKTYTQHQHAVAIMLMKYENKPYRDIAKLLEELWVYFGFGNSVPHFTTLQKFFDRIPTYIWDFLIAKTYRLFTVNIADVAIDTTGYQLNHSSRHYEQRTGLRKRFMKHVLSVDTNKIAIICSDGKRSYVNDNKTFKPIAKKTREIIPIGDLSADRGFDAEENHRFAYEELGVKTVAIPPRKDIPAYKTKGWYRKRLRRHFPKDVYNEREKIETVHSVEKRKFGDELRSRLLRMQRREMKVVDVVYNIHRYINYCISVFIGFLQSRYFAKDTDFCLRSAPTGI